MKNKILKWWNREWSNWEEWGKKVQTIYDSRLTPKKNIIGIIYKRTSNDGLVEFKTVKI